jgi:alkanesulfonate monooxygenase SsuD/methylene tetrahydromethanopterin reductase-like flavin-dependent oxidoreductase (luciferase family)
MITLQNAPIPELHKRWRWLEEAGFDRLYVADMTHDYRPVDKGAQSGFGASPGFWLDGWTVLADMASRTQRVRIGPLVTSPLLRPPALVALEAATVDQLCGGRLDLGFGQGVGSDHRPLGVGRWSWQERGDRFREYVALVDELLRCREGHVEFSGTYYSTAQPALNPGTLQRPRPPILVAGQSRAVLEVAVEIADAWNAFPRRFGDSVELNLENFRKASEKIDRLCEAAQRDPASLRRSLALSDDLSFWQRSGILEEIVERFGKLGCEEFVLEWPPEEHIPLLERLASDVIPALREG